jgi:hypothetical protein
MKAAIVVAAVSIAAVAAIALGATMWSESEPKGALNDKEMAWLRHYNNWAHKSRARRCSALARAPSAPLRRIERLARAACRGEQNWSRVEDAVDARFFYSRPLPTTSALTSESHVDPRIGRVASRLAGRNVEARCWSADDWGRVNGEFQAVYPNQHDWAEGLADRYGRVHFNGEICQTLTRFFGSRYTPSLNLERADLAWALHVLAHEAEHHRDFAASHREVECRAVQRVRGLVRASGRSKAFAAEIAAYAWDVSYARNDPEYGTALCRNGSSLDLHPRSDAWP